MSDRAQLTPFRFRALGDRLVVTNECGGFGLFDQDMPHRLFADSATEDETVRLRDLSILIGPEANWRLVSLKRQLREKLTRRNPDFSYLIVVPTLRCNLACSYCQVSRAPLGAPGFDWTETELEGFESFLASVQGDSLKIEIQGGEPTLRPDLIRRIIELSVGRFSTVQYVICTNLGELNPEIEAIIARDDVVISTSIDGPAAAMTANRTRSPALTDRTLANFRSVLARYGPQKISALPTVTAETIKDPRSLIDTYVELGFDSIFLRPVNFMGFARKAHLDLATHSEPWLAFYRSALDYIVELNRDRYFEEYYLALLVRSVFADVPHGYVDFRSPAHYGTDYCVIDFDGKIYPTDEARMLTRTRHVELSIGSLSDGIDWQKVSALNESAIHQTHPDCQHCAYMPYCGIDIVDDLSRYSRVDLPKSQTAFCRRQLALFDLIFEKVIAQDRPYLDMFLKWIFRRSDPPPAYDLFHD